MRYTGCLLVCHCARSRSSLTHLWVYLQVKHKTTLGMREEQTHAAVNITSILDIYGMLSQGYAGDNAMAQADSKGK